MSMDTGDPRGNEPGSNFQPERESRHRLLRSLDVPHAVGSSENVQAFLRLAPGKHRGASVPSTEEIPKPKPFHAEASLNVMTHNFENNKIF